MLTVYRLRFTVYDSNDLNDFNGFSALNGLKELSELTKIDRGEKNLARRRKSRLKLMTS